LKRIALHVLQLHLESLLALLDRRYVIQQLLLEKGRDIFRQPRELYRAALPKLYTGQESAAAGASLSL